MAKPGMPVGRCHGWRAAAGAELFFTGSVYGLNGWRSRMRGGQLAAHYHKFTGVGGLPGPRFSSLALLTGQLDSDATQNNPTTRQKYKIV
jgi:hypothetical protein